MLVPRELGHRALDDRRVGREVGLPRLLRPHQGEDVAQAGRVSQPEASPTRQASIHPVEDAFGRGVTAREAEEQRAEPDLLSDQGIVVESPSRRASRHFR
jgi:hypothetical protein